MVEPQQGDNHGGSSLVRPFIITGGRARSSSRDLPIETLVTATGKPVGGGGTIEWRRIAEMCAKPTSVAEVAARVGVPIGVARVLVSDMVAAGLLETHQVASDADTEFIERLINGIRSL